MKAVRRALGAIGLSAALAACATIERGTTDDIPVATDPPGAGISSSTGTFCTSPCSVSGSRKEDIAITITKPGYTSQTVVAQSKPGDTLAAAQANEFTADALGRFIDVQGGAHFKHVPAAFVVKLVPET